MDSFMGGVEQSRPVARTVIVDDHPVVREGLRAILEREPTVQVVGEAGNPLTALSVVEVLKPDIVLLDLRLGGESEKVGLELCRTMHTRFPSVRVLVLTTFINEQLVLEAVRSGARGYVLKDVDAIQLVKAIGAVRQGESAFDSHAAAAVVRCLTSETPSIGDSESLSEREREVLALVARGLSNQEVGVRLYISPTTVKFHLRNIMSKLGVHRRAELAWRAGRLDAL
jgi:two-component system, NarL family, response regulator DevR